MDIREAIDSEEKPSEFSDGRLVIEGTLARTGVQIYSAGSFDLPGDPNRPVRVYRPHSEVFDKQSMASFDGIAVTVGHANVDVHNWRRLAVGDVRNIRREGDLMLGTVTIRDAAAIETVKAGLKALSNGYSFHLDMTPGVTPSGEEYDAVQRNIRGNHLAIVAKARCGDRCKLAIDEEEKSMDEETPIEVETVTPTTEELLAAAVTELESLKAQLAALSASVGDSAEKLAASEARVAELQSPAHIARVAKDWAEMTVSGSKIIPGFATDAVESVTDYQRSVLRAVLAKDGDARKAMILAVTGGKNACDAEESLIQSAFRLLASLPEAKKEDNLGKKILETADAAQPAVGANAFHARMMNGFK